MLRGLGYAFGDTSRAGKIHELLCIPGCSAKLISCCQPKLQAADASQPCSQWKVKDSGANHLLNWPNISNVVFCRSSIALLHTIASNIVFKRLLIRKDKPIGRESSPKSGQARAKVTDASRVVTETLPQGARSSGDVIGPGPLGPVVLGGFPCTTEKSWYPYSNLSSGGPNRGDTLCHFCLVPPFVVFL